MVHEEPQSLPGEPASSGLGWEVSLDAEKLLEAKHADGLTAQLARSGVLIMRGLHLTPEQHLRLATVFGMPRTPPPGLPTLATEGHPEISVLDSAAGFRADAWHADETYTDKPPTAAILCMRQRPHIGGDTLWINQYLAYECLSEPMRALLAPLRVRHAAPDGQSATHPAVMVHPVTGRRHLFVNEAFAQTIEGLTPSESRAVLSILTDVSRVPELIYRHQWTDGDVIVWDNRCTQHYAMFDFGGQRRVVHSVDVVDPDVGAEATDSFHPEKAE